MKHSVVYLFLSLLIFISCGPKDKNIPIVKKQFKAYVQKTFDDPSYLKEIVEISVVDTISYKSTMALIRITNEFIDQYRDIWHKKDSLLQEQMQAVLTGPKLKRKPTYSESYRLNKLVDECSSYSVKIAKQKNNLTLIQQRIKLKELYLSYHPAVYVYEVLFRQQESGGLKLKKVYAYVDSEVGFKSIIPQKDDSLVSEDYNDIVKLCKDCLISMNPIQEMYDKQQETWEELQELDRRLR